MENFIGEHGIKIKNTPFKNYKPSDWAIYFIEKYGYIDGLHHKIWLLDQIARILKGTKVKISLAKWDTGQCEFRVSTGTLSKKYLKWVECCKGEIIDGEYEYSYDEGIAP